MDCLDCGKDFDELDLMAESCQSCGEPLMPDDVDSLRKLLGHEQKVPEIKIPEKKQPAKLPDTMECEKCEEDLYLEEISNYLDGNPCPHCGHVRTKSSEIEPSQTQPTAPENVVEKSAPEQPISQETSQSSGIPTMRMRICTGPLVGSEIDFDRDLIIGRELLTKIIETESVRKGTSAEWYSKPLSKISREHFKIEFDGSITDMGSTNGTIYNRKEIYGTGEVMMPGGMLNLGDQIFLTPISQNKKSITITNWRTRISVDIGEGSKFHFGRLREDGRREPFAMAVQVHVEGTDGMKFDDYKAISRRHCEIEFTSENKILLHPLGGKKVSYSTGKQDLNDPFMNLSQSLVTSTTASIDLEKEELLCVSLGKDSFIIILN